MSAHPFRHADPYEGPTVRGVDLSAYQASVDFHAVAADGIAFAYSRAMEGVHADRTFLQHSGDARHAGIISGAYHFMRPALDVDIQAAAFCRLLGRVWQPGDLPPMLDVERGDNEGHEADKALRWLEVVERFCGARPIIYAGAFAAEHMNDPRIAEYACCTAWYGPAPCLVPRPFTKWQFWQIGQTPVHGVHGRVDTDVFRGDLAALRTFCGR